MSEPLLQVDPFIFIACAIIFGFIIGSFLNVVIARFPRMMFNEASPADTPFNLAIPRSHCFQCKQPIIWCHNIPIFSYLYLRGRCYRCKAPIGKQHLIIELLTGVLCGFFAWRYGFSMLFFAAITFTAFAIALSVLDLQLMMLPDKLTLPLLWIGLWFNLDAIFVPLHSAVIGAMTGYLSLWSIYWIFKILTKKEGLGHGDFKLFAAIGAFFGWASLPFIAASAAILALIAILFRSLLKLGHADQPISFGPFLLIGSFIILCIGSDFLQYFSFAIT
jgi:leader peptidase (prepilin peptidase)/N-methyltransferase